MLHAMDLTSSTSRTDQINADLDTIQAAPQVRALRWMSRWPRK